jgi:tetratricopeptide (TPR) repeat protein
MKIAGLIVAVSLMTCGAATAGILGKLDELPKGVNARDAFEKGVDLLGQEKLDAAEGAFRESLRLQPAQAVSYVGLADIATRLRRYAEAEQFLRTAIRRSSGLGVQEAWGRFLFEIGRYQESEPVLRKVAAGDAANGPVRIAWGDALLRGFNKAPEAEAAYRDGLKLAPQHAGGHFGLGMALQRQGRLEEAAAEFKKSAALAPSNAMPLQALGELMAARKDWDGALRTFQQALDRDPDYLTSRLARGDVFNAKGDFAQAVQEYALASRSQPKLALAKLKAGISLQAWGKRSDARTSYLEAVELDGKTALAYNNLAWMAAEDRKDLDKARVWAGKAVSLAPSTWTFQDTLGWVRHLSRDEQGALDALRKAASLPGADASVFYHLGAVAAQAGQRAEAAQAYARALKFDPASSFAKDARRFVESGAR